MSYLRGERKRKFKAEINVVPYIDVMLVLLIIFLITIPVVNTSILVKLPQQAVEANHASADDVLISVDAQGSIYWFNRRIESDQALRQALAQVALAQPQPEVHVRGDARAAYDAIGRVVLACQLAGIQRVGFLTEPPEN